MHRNRLLRIAAPLAAVATLAVAVPVHAEGPGGYGKNDGGGFRNVLPPGQNGLATFQDYLAFQSKGTRPRHWADQQPLYENLLYASPSLSDDQVDDYFKDATFGVRKAKRESVVEPRDGVTIIRDADYGVPRVYGQTRKDTMFGAGYASAADRLFLMDVLRHTGRADLSNFLGGGNVQADANQWQFAPYTEADLEDQLRRPGRGSQKAWKKLRGDVKAYVGGINTYITAARKDPQLMPAEYTAIGKRVQRWKQTDVIATASLFGGIFGRGGGAEVASGLAFRALEARFGTDEARALWSGFRDRNDPSAPTTVPGSFPYMTGDSFAAKGLAIPDAGSVTPAKVVSGQKTARSLASEEAPRAGAGFGELLLEERLDGHHSNWLLLAGRESASGRPMAVMGPQVGYYLPQVLTEIELHGPGIDARGAAFPGVSMYVQLGRGRDYAWSATSAGSDNTDTFAEVLCSGSKHKYRYKGKCRTMDKLVRKLSWTPNRIDSTPAGTATLTAYRTVHGVVRSYGTVGGKPVAFVTARSTYLHEADSIEGFRRLNRPGDVKGPKGFHKAASKIRFTFNWAYTDSTKTAYYLSGAYPRRAKGTSPDFPILGTGEYDWVGFDPQRNTSDLIEPDDHPRAVDRAVTVSWNNKPAKDWAAADDQWGYGPLYRSDLIEEKLRDAVAGDKKATLAQMVQAMEESATQDIRGVKVLPTVFEVMGTPTDPQVAQAVQTLKAWTADGAHRRDLDRDGVYERSAAVEIMDAWWPRLVAAQFESALGAEAFEAVQSLVGIGATSTSPRAPGFSDGWWGYTVQDLQSLLAGGQPVPGGFSRVFCGGGDPAACRSALEDSLKQALSVSPRQTYGVGACAADPQPSCWDKNRPRVTAAIGQPGAFPFQNRPTFQQVVSVGKPVKR
jgi:acyl-homoserine lactone acylase PvdQ